MARNIERIAADLEAISAQDFDSANAGADGWKRLDQLCEELRAINDVKVCAPVMFHAMERLDGSDLGTPGPLVHTLEHWIGGYEPFLLESVRRKPTSLSVWMINRILNAEPANREMWLALLQSVADHPMASEETKQVAFIFIEHQNGK